MKYNSIYCLIIVIILASCEKTTTYSAFIKNDTNHNISILFYKNGYVNSEDSIFLKPNEIFQIAFGTDRGITKNAGFYSKYRGDVQDSTVVIFDSLYYVTHYYYNPPDSINTKHIMLESTRNILNNDSYIYEIEDKSNYSRRVKYTFEFSNADYEFAKN